MNASQHKFWLKIGRTVLFFGLAFVLAFQSGTLWAADGDRADDLDQVKNPAALFLPLVRQPKAAGSLSRYDVVAAEMLKLVNEERARNGCSAVAVDQRLNTAAQTHTEDMAVNRFLSHQGSDGSWPHERIRDEGYAYLWAGETCAMATNDSAKFVFDMWMDSPAHRGIILNCKAEDIGIGYALPYWTLDLATPR